MARVTAPNTSGLRPTSRACSSVTVPKPVSEPMNAAGLRPTPSISACNARRPDVAGRSVLGKIAPSSASVSPRRAPPWTRSAVLKQCEPAVEAALADFARDILEHDLRTVEPHHATKALRHQPGREHRALRFERDTAVQAGRQQAIGSGRPAGSARGRSRRASRSPSRSPPAHPAWRLQTIRRRARCRRSAAPAGPGLSRRRSCRRVGRDRASPADRKQTATCPCRRRRSGRRQACLRTRSSHARGDPAFANVSRANWAVQP